MLTDIEIQEAAKQYVQNQIKAWPAMTDHELEIFGWRMAAEEHLSTIDRLRDEIRGLKTQNRLLEQALKPLTLKT